MKPAITSKSNPTYKLIKSLETKKGRDKSGLFFVEGRRMVDEALTYAAGDIFCIAVTEDFYENNKLFMNSIDESGKYVYTLTASLFKDICGTQSPQGIAAVIKQPSSSIPSVSDLRFVLILDRIAEPGNMGTIIRTAEAAGVDLIYLMKGSADIYNPKVVRSTMGSIFRMQFYSADTPAELEALKEYGFTLIATSLEGAEKIETVAIPKKRAVIIGSEATGVSTELLSLADLKIRLSMCGKVESLNAAVATGIILYMLKG